MDMSHDQPLPDVKPPRFMRECIEGITESEQNPRRYLVCLRETEAMIIKFPDACAEVSYLY